MRRVKLSPAGSLQMKWYVIGSCHAGSEEGHEMPLPPPDERPKKRSGRKRKFFDVPVPVAPAAGKAGTSGEHLKSFFCRMMCEFLPLPTGQHNAP